MATTRDAAYADRLARLQLVRWKERLRPLDPYGWHLRGLRPGFTLDVGCGVGRTLDHIHGYGVGIDHNPDAVARCRERGLRAYTPEEFATSRWAAPGTFDSLLFAHVLEHVDPGEVVELVSRYLPQLRAGGQVIILTPQERGFASDPTHVAPVDHERAADIAAAAGLGVVHTSSFPLPRRCGRWFTHNQFVTVARPR